MKIALLLLTCIAAFAQPSAQAIAGAATGSVTTGSVNTTSCTPYCLEQVYVTGFWSATNASQYPVCTDSLNNPLTLVQQQNEDGDTNVMEYVSLNITTGASETVTCSSFNSVNTIIAVSFWPNVASGPDQISSKQGSSAQATGTITPTNNDELILNGCNSAFAATTGISPTTLLNNLFVSPGGYSTPIGLANSYQSQTTATAVNPTCTGAGAVYAAMVSSWYTTSAPATLTVTTAQLPEGSNGVSYGVGAGPGSNKLAANGGLGSYSWSCTSGCTGSTITGSGISLSSAGLLTGTAVTGTYTVQFQVADSDSHTANSVSLTLTVAAAALSISTSTLAGATQYLTYSASIAGAGGTTPYTYSYDTTGHYPAPPEGIAFNSSTGTLTSSLVGGSGGYEPLWILTDAVGAVVSKEISIAVTGNYAWAVPNCPTSAIFPCNAIWYHRMDAASTGLPAYTGTGVLLPLPSHSLHANFGANPLPWPNGIPMVHVPYNQANVGVGTSEYQYYFGTTGTFAVSGATWSGGTATLTTATNNLANSGSNITVTGISPSGYNVTNAVITGATATTVSYAVSNPGSSYVSGGIAAVAGTTAVGTPASTAPIPPYAPVEGGAPNGCYPGIGLFDCHSIVYLEAGGGNPPGLYELYTGQSVSSGASWLDFSNALWANTTTNQMTLQGAGTSNAGGIPFGCCLITADEIIGTGTPTAPNGAIKHISLFTITRFPGSFSTLNNWFWPATSETGDSGCTGVSGTLISQSSPPASCPNKMAFGAILRVKAGTSAPACLSTSPQSSIIWTALQNYGMMMYDNGSDGYLQGTPDARLVDTDLACVQNGMNMNQFEYVNVSSLMVSNDSFQTVGSAYSPISSGTVVSGGGIH